MPEVVMPRLSDSMEEGTILKWLKSDGDEVKRGEPLAEIETDKATMTYEADADGTFAILVQEGETRPVGEPIARIGEGGGEQSGGAQQATQQASSGAGEQQAAASAGTGQESGGASGGGAATRVAPSEPAAPAVANGSNGHGAGERVKASPVARRIAREAGIDLAALSGSGPGGRIVKADVEQAAARGPQPAAQPQAEPAAAPAAAAAPAPAPAEDGGSGKGGARSEELSRIQTQIARRMAESKATVPDFTLQTEVNMERAVELRSQLKQAAGEDGVAPSYNDMIVKAVGLALREHPRANGSYKDGHFELYERVNVGVAVAAQDSLIVPTVFDADRKSLGQIARDSRALAERVRSGEITPPELSGGTFTVSNLGMYGITSFTAVINPPQAAILAVGALREIPVVENGQVVPGQRMSMTLVCDHRILYGAPAAEFLARIRELLEQPLALAL